MYLGLPTTAGISILGAESPAMPALQKPEPLSSTMALNKKEKELTISLPLTRFWNRYTYSLETFFFLFL